MTALCSLISSAAFAIGVNQILGDVLLRSEISLKVICEKVKRSNYDFANIFMTMKEHTYKLFKNIFYDVQTEGKYFLFHNCVLPSKSVT